MRYTYVSIGRFKLFVVINAHTTFIVLAYELMEHLQCVATPTWYRVKNLASNIHVIFFSSGILSEIIDKYTHLYT